MHTGDLVRPYLISGQASPPLGPMTAAYRGLGQRRRVPRVVSIAGSVKYHVLHSLDSYRTFTRDMKRTNNHMGDLGDRSRIGAHTLVIRLQQRV